MRYCYKNPKFDFYDAVTTEHWLSDLAKDGLVFVGTNFACFRFLKTEPLTIKYRIEPIIDENLTPSDEMINAYGDAGWEFVCCLNKLFFIWKSTLENAIELHSDPIVQSEGYIRLCKKLKKQAIALTLQLIIMFTIILCGFIFSDRPISLFSASPLYLLLLVMEIFIASQAIMQANRSIRIKKMLAEGFSIYSEKKYNKKFEIYRSVNAITLIFSIAILFISFFNLTTDWRKNIADLEKPIPYISLDLIEQSEEFSWKAPFYFNNDGIDYNNYVDFSWSLFVPEYYEIYQAGGYQSHKWPDGSGYYAPSARTEYYRLNIPFFAPLLFEELIDIHLWENEEYIITELDAFERAMIFEDEYMKHLFVLEDKQVFYLQYHGYADLSQIVPLLDEILTLN